MDFDPTRRLRLLLPFATAAGLLLLLDAAVSQLMAGSQLDLGTSLNLPTPGYARFLALWMLYGSLAVAALTVGFVRWLERGDLQSRLSAAWIHGNDRKWVIYGSLFAFLIPAALRTFLLHGTPLTDDESAYRFMAQVLASGRVYADSPPLKLFFDNRFMINDGKMYSHFFVGWPALLVPGVWLGIPGFMNAIYSALTLPALFGVLRRLTSSAWARAGVLMYLSSPMLMVAAATETSHTSCVCALAWFTWLCLKSQDTDTPWWTHSLLATVFCVAFFIRPTSALGIGLPLLIWWLWGLRRGSGLRGLLAFAVPAIALAALFLTVNKLQTGSYFEVAYQRAFTYAEENGFRFSLWPTDFSGDAFTELQFGSLEHALAILGAALFRFNITFLGWPCSLLFALFAGRGTLRRVIELSFVSFLALHFFTNNVGIDTFAPMHYFELAWPLLILNICGLQKITENLTTASAAHQRWATALPAATLAALILTNIISYAPTRFAAINRVADNISQPQQVHRAAELGPSVIFVREPFIRYCRSKPTGGWVFSRPNNDPLLENPVLWVNHLSLEKNRLLMQRFPDRQGYVMAWDPRCRVVFLPLNELAPGAVPDAPISGIDEVQL